MPALPQDEFAKEQSVGKIQADSLNDIVSYMLQRQIDRKVHPYSYAPSHKDSMAWALADEQSEVRLEAVHHERPQKQTLDVTLRHSRSFRYRTCSNVKVIEVTRRELVRHGRVIGV